MARPELSKWEVWHAADALLAANNGEPTDEQVLARLGCDDQGLIAPALKIWRERRACIAGAGMPDTLSALVLALYQEQTTSSVRLIEECRSTAAEELDVVRRRADTLSAELERITTNLRAELRQQQDNAIRLQAKNVSLAAEVQRANDELGKAVAKHAEMREQLDEARARIAQNRSGLAREKWVRRACLRELKARQEGLIQLETALRSAQEESDAAHIDLQSLRIERANLVTERDSLKHRAEAAEGRAIQAEAQAGAAQQRVSQLHTRIDQLRAHQDQKTDERIQKLSKLLLGGGTTGRAGQKSDE